MYCAKRTGENTMTATLSRRLGKVWSLIGIDLSYEDRLKLIDYSDEVEQSNEFEELPKELQKWVLDAEKKYFSK